MQTPSEMKPQYQTEFPDFDPATMPAIPEGFADISWHNDACPAFHHQTVGLVLFVDYADKASREFAESCRFQLCACDADGAPEETLLESEDWAEVVEALAEVGVMA